MKEITIKEENLSQQTAQDQLIGLGWFDFGSYPKQGQRVLIHAKGFDIKRREWTHLFFKVNKFNAMRFPTKAMEKKTSAYPVKWEYTWIPQKKSYLKLFNVLE